MNVGEGAARRLEKTDVRDGHASSGTRFGTRTTTLVFSVVTWPEVVRVLQRDETRERVLARYRGAGFTPDDFSNKRTAREAMADALAHTEDWLELRSAGMSRERQALREIRRRLDWELW